MWTVVSDPEVKDFVSQFSKLIIDISTLQSTTEVNLAEFQ